MAKTQVWLTDIKPTPGTTNTGDVPTLQSDGSLAMQAPSGGIAVHQIFGGTGLSGDTIIFNSTLTPSLGAVGLSVLKNAAFNPDTMAVFGWLLDNVTLNGTARVQTFGLLPVAILPALSAGYLTVDLTNGLIRSLIGGEQRFGIADGNGNALMFSTGFNP